MSGQIMTKSPLLQSIKVKKRDGTTVDFDASRIQNAVQKAFYEEYGVAKPLHSTPAEIALDVSNEITTLPSSVGQVSVEYIQDLVERRLMSRQEFSVAKRYILYRQHRNEIRKKTPITTTRNLFKHRESFKPFEYHELDKFRVAINNAIWFDTEWNYVSDSHDFRVNLTDHKREVVRRCLLAISQVEAAYVKRFWLKVYDRFPKPEIDGIGATFAESEVRHAHAYSNLLTKLGMDEDFADLMSVPVIAKRSKYLQNALKSNSTATKEDYILILTRFTLLVENLSLFTQFLIMKSFNQFDNVLKDVDNVIQATMQEETLHAQFGAALIGILQEERPEIFTDTFWAKVNTSIREAVEAEGEIVDWIMDGQDLPHLSLDAVKEFIKIRANLGLTMLNRPPMYTIDKELETSQLKWFTTELQGEVDNDNFNKKSTAYTKNVQSVTPGDLF